MGPYDVIGENGFSLSNAGDFVALCQACVREGTDVESLPLSESDGFLMAESLRAYVRDNPLDAKTFDDCLSVSPAFVKLKFAEGSITRTLRDMKVRLNVKGS